MDSIHFYRLYTSVKMGLAEARQQALRGQKDKARDFLRFIQGSHVLDVLNTYDGPLNIDVSLLRWECGQLQNAVHPLNEPDARMELRSIEDKLSLIAGYVVKQTTKNGGSREKLGRSKSRKSKAKSG